LKIKTDMILRTEISLVRTTGKSIRYYTTEEFNVDSKAECSQLNLAHVARNKKSIKRNYNKQNL